MKIKQFEDKGLAQYSYAILSKSLGEMVLIDPARDPNPYYEYAKTNNSRIVAVILTHSHADFASSHAEIQRQTKARIFVSSHMDAKFPHEKVDEGHIITIGEIKLKSIYTPGHSFDSICILLEHEGIDKIVFTGDTLFVGDVGRPDLRGSDDNSDKMRRELAKKMYHTVHSKLKLLPKAIKVYPGHGAGTLCGKSLSKDPSSTIGREIKENYAFEERGENSFVNLLIENQPFIPPYFRYDVALNKIGTINLEESILRVRRLQSPNEIDTSDVVIDTRSGKEFKENHLTSAINIPNGGKFETWLGTLVSPDKKFFLIAKDNIQLEDVIRKAAKIGYETNIKGAIVIEDFGNKESDILNISVFKGNPSKYTIIDIRSSDEVADNKPFENSINIPLPELPTRVHEIPTNKPIVVHCAGGYRSAIGASILEKELPGHPVFDLSEAIKEFQPHF